MVSSSGASARSGASTSAPKASSPSTAPSMMARRRPRISAGIESSSGTSSRRNDVVTSSGASAHHATQRGQDLLDGRPVPGEEAGDDGLERLELELERTDDTERRAAAAERPEQVGVAVGGRPDEGAVGKHDLDCRDGVALQTESPGVPADPATDRVADHADVGGGRVQRGQPVTPAASARSPQSTPAPTRAIRRSASMRSSFIADGAQQHGIGQPALQRRGAVAGALRRDGQAGGGGGPDDLGDLLGEGGVGDGGGIVRHLEVPRRAGEVVRRVAGKVHRTAAETSQAGRAQALLHRHGSLLSWSCAHHRPADLRES